MDVEITGAIVMKNLGLLLAVSALGLAACDGGDSVDLENPELPGPDDNPNVRGANCPSLAGPVAFHFDRSEVAAMPGAFIVETPMVSAQNCAGNFDLYLRAVAPPFNGQFSIGRFAIDGMSPLESCGLCAAFSTDQGPLFRATGGTVDVFSLAQNGLFFVTLNGVTLGELDPMTGTLLPGGRVMRAGGTISVPL